MEQLQKDQEFLQAAQATLEAETKEMVKVSDRLHDNLVKAMRLMWRQLLFIWAVVILLFVAYFFVLGKPSPVNRVATPSLKPIEKSGETPGIITSPQVPPAQQAMQSLPFPEWEEIMGILEQIRIAQLTKDVNLFFKAYSPNFPNIAKKKETLLRTWQQYDYLDMHFNIESIQKTDSNTIIAKVVWDITLEDVRSKKKCSLSKDYTVRFSQDSGKWFIQDLIQGEKTSAVPVWFS